MTEESELPTPAYLRDLAERIFRIPTVHGVDGYDYDRLLGIAREFETLPSAAKPAPTFEDVLDEAHAAAKKVVSTMPLEDGNAFDCGFAWVSIFGSDGLARSCRAAVKKGGDVGRYGRKMEGLGHTWWKPGGFSGQAIGHHEAGAKAFRDVLAKHGIRATVGSRYD